MTQKYIGWPKKNATAAVICHFNDIIDKMSLILISPDNIFSSKMTPDSSIIVGKPL